MSRLEQYFQEPTVEAFDFDEAEDLIEALEHFLGDEEETDVAMEGRIADLFKERKESIQDTLKSMLRGAGSVQEGFQKRLELMQQNLRSLDNDVEIKVRLTGIAPYLYDADRRKHRLNIANAIKEDVRWVDGVIGLLGDVDKAIDHNDRILDAAPIGNGPAAFLAYWSDRGNKRITHAGEVLGGANVGGQGLYFSRFKMAKGFDETKKFDEYKKQRQAIQLVTSKVNAAPSAQSDIEKGLTLSKRDAQQIIASAIEFSKKTSEVQRLVEHYGKRHHPRTGEVHKNTVDTEARILEKIEAATYVKGIQVLIGCNVSLMGTIEKVPTKLMSRNLKILRGLIRFCEQFF